MNITDYDRLCEIKDELKELISEAKELVYRESGMAYERARGYWIAAFETNLDKDHGWLGGSMCTMEDTLKELEPSADDECQHCGCDCCPNDSGDCVCNCCAEDEE